jgi:hypothetical protein
MSLENTESQKFDQEAEKTKERQKFNEGFDAAAKDLQELPSANGERPDLSVDFGKFNATSATLSTMGEAEIAKLEKTVPQENAAEFREAADTAKADFLSESERVMVNPKLNPEEKRDQIETLYRTFTGRIEEAQGKINGKYAKASEQTKIDTEKDAKNTEKKNRDFREAFEKSFKEAGEKVQQEQMELAKQERLKRVLSNQNAEAAVKPPLDFAEKAIKDAR